MIDMDSPDPGQGFADQLESCHKELSNVLFNTDIGMFNLNSEESDNEEPFIEL